MENKRFISLSDKSLEKVFEWSDNHHKEGGLAHYYMEACSALGSALNIDAYDIFETDQNTDQQSIDCVYESRKKLREVRDRIGRLILAEIKNG